MAVAIKRLWIKLTADRKRFGMLCGALAVGLLFWARLIVVSNVPRTAIADDKATDFRNMAKGNDQPASQRADATHSKSDGAAWPDNAEGQQSAGSARRSSRRATAQRIELPSSMSRDPFVISPRYFPKPTPLTPITKEQGKSQPEPVEEAQQIEARTVAVIQAYVDRLKLEAALGGSLAVINGRTYRLGESIVVAGAAGSGGTSKSLCGEFRLVEINQRSVTLECDGRKFEIQMTFPGAR